MVPASMAWAWCFELEMQRLRGTMMTNAREVIFGDTLHIVDHLIAMESELCNICWIRKSSGISGSQGTCASHRQRHARRSPRNCWRLGASMCATSIWAAAFFRVLCYVPTLLPRCVCQQSLYEHPWNINFSILQYLNNSILQCVFWTLCIDYCCSENQSMR